MDWQSVVQNLVTSGLLISAVAFVAKSAISQWMARNIEGFKAALIAENTRSVEELRSKLQMEAQRQQIMFGSLHARRAEVIAELYEKLNALDRAVQVVLTQQWFRGIREETDRLLPPGPSRIRPGYEELGPSEQKGVDDLRRLVSDFYQFYGGLRIYFTPEACDLLDRFGTLSSFLASSYDSIALKDREGKLYVNPKVKEVWDGAVSTIPQLKILLEKEFRNLLGVMPTPQ